MLTSFQQALHDEVMYGKHSHVFGVVGRRGGKTHTAGDVAKHWIRETGRSLFYVASSLDQRRQFMQYSRLQQRFTATPSFGWVRENWRDLMIFDDYQHFPLCWYEDLVAPMLNAMPGRKALFLLTPLGGHVKPTEDNSDPHHAEKLVQAFIEEQNPQVAVFNWPSHANPALSIGGFTALRQQMNPETFRKEIAAEIG